jgi:D-alanyl-D-alanine carboxypeptidase
MVFSRLLLLLAAVTLAPLSTTVAQTRAQPTRPAPATPPPDPTAVKGAIVLDAATGNVLFEDRADIVSPPASMTKLMTFAVVYDQLQARALTLETPVRITREDAAMGGTQVFLDPRETFTVEELIYAMMIQSANDAAHSLARAAGGSINGFLELMNAKARELGMTNTTFRTPHGLPHATRNPAQGDLTSPRDFARLSRHLLLKTDVLKYSAIRTRPFGEGKRKEAMAMSNHNNLLGRVDGVDGLKTGFTNGAGFCLAATAQRSGRRVIVVTMGSPQQKVRDLYVTGLIERGFAALPAASTPVSKANASDIGIVPAPRPAPASPTPDPVVKFSIPKR